LRRRLDDDRSRALAELWKQVSDAALLGKGRRGSVIPCFAVWCAGRESAKEGAKRWAGQKGASVAEQISNFAEIAKEKSAQSEAYLKQWVMWLGIGSAGGAIAMASLAAHLPNPSHAFSFLLPSFWCFLIGAASAGASVLVLSIKLGAMAEHFTNAHNRAELHGKIQATPEVLSAPQRLSDRANVRRNDAIGEHDKFHERAERAWKAYVFWNRVWLLCVSLSSIGFILGFAWPLIKISVGMTLIP
jgi:hypothetical protein